MTPCVCNCFILHYFAFSGFRMLQNAINIVGGSCVGHNIDFQEMIPCLIASSSINMPLSYRYLFLFIFNIFIDSNNVGFICIFQLLEEDNKLRLQLVMWLPQAIWCVYKQGELKQDEMILVLDELTPITVMWCPFENHRVECPFYDICLYMGCLMWCVAIVPYIRQFRSRKHAPPISWL